MGRQGGASTAANAIISLNDTLKPARGGRVRSEVIEVLLSFAREIS